MAPAATSPQARIERVFEIRAPPERVFEAFTSREDLRFWLHHSYEIDAREGGAFQFGGVPGVPLTRGEFLEVVPNELLVYSWRYNEVAEEGGDPESNFTDDTPTRVTVRFHRVGEATRVELTHEGFPEKDEKYWQYYLGWQMLGAEFLKHFLEHGREATEAWWEANKERIGQKFEQELRHLVQAE